jgi:hypothetical protein
MRIRVTQRAETIIIFLASGIPQSQLNVLAVDFDIGNIVLKNGRNVHLCFNVRLSRVRLREGVNNLGECALGKDDQEASLYKEAIKQVEDKKPRRKQYLAASTVTNNNEFPANVSHMRGDEFECLGGIRVQR